MRARRAGFGMVAPVDRHGTLAEFPANAFKLDTSHPVETCVDGIGRRRTHPDDNLIQKKGHRSSAPRQTAPALPTLAKSYSRLALAGRDMFTMPLVFRPQCQLLPGSLLGSRQKASLLPICSLVPLRRG